MDQKAWIGELLAEKSKHQTDQHPEGEGGAPEDRADEAEDRHPAL
jgi:hypothetical protein